MKLDAVLIAEDSYERLELTKLDSVDEDVFVHMYKQRRILLLFHDVQSNLLIADMKRAAENELLKRNGHPLHTVAFEHLWYDFDAKTISGCVVDTDEPATKIWVTLDSSTKPKLVESEPKRSAETLDLLKIWRSLSWTQKASQP